MVGRREQLRAELLRSVRQAALVELRASGPAGLSLRAIAREVGISPAGLYRYYDGRDALLTMLITDGYDDLADHLFLAQGATAHLSELGRDRRVPEQLDADDDPRRRLEASFHAYRRWALDHPNEFSLLFGEPVQGYAAPQDGSTTDANARMAMALTLPLFDAWQQGRVDLPPVDEAPAGVAALAAAIEEVSTTRVPVGFAVLSLSLWSWLHGFVALDVNGQFHWMDPGGADELFAATLAERLRVVRPA